MLLDDIFFDKDVDAVYKRLGLPYQVWKKEYDTNSEKLIEEVINPLCNYNMKTTMAGGLFGNTHNPLSNYDRYDGVFDKLESDYGRAFLYGDFQSEDEEKLRDFNFYWYAISRIEAEMLRTDIQFTCNIVNREAGMKRKQRNSEIGAEAMVRSVIENVKQKTQGAPEEGQEQAPADGVDLSFAKNKKLIIPNDIDELMKQLNDKEISSAQTYTLLNHVKEKYNLKREINSKNLKDKAKINATFGIIEINNQNDPVYRRLEPKSVSWVGPTEIGIKGFDENCDAVQVSEMIPISKAFTLDRGLFEDNLTTAAKIQEYIKKLDKSHLDGLKEAAFNTTTESQDKFGTFWAWKPGTGLNVCRQHLFFKMIHPKFFKVLYKGKNITAEQYKLYKNYKQNIEDISFVEVPDNYIEQAGEKVISIPIVKLHEAIRYGDKHVLMHREYPIQQRTSGNLIDVSYPIIGCVWPDKSIVTVGKDMGYLYHITMKKLMEEMKNLSISDMLNVDVNQLPDGYTYEHIPYMIKEKINLYDGSKQAAISGNREAGRHLTTTKISVSPNEIQALFNLAMIISNTFYRIIGIPLESNIIQKASAQNKDQEQPAPGSMALLPFYDEFIEEFTNQAFQKLADIGRYCWSRDTEKQVILGKGQTALMKIDASVRLDEQGIHVINDYKSLKDKEFILNVGSKAISSGGLGFGEWIKMYHSENPEQISAMFSEGMSVLEKMQAQKQQADAQNAQMQQQIDAQKMQIPIMVQKEITERVLNLQDKIDQNKDEREAAKMENKGEQSDIDFQQTKEIKRIEKQLELALDEAKQSRSTSLNENVKNNEHIRAQNAEDNAKERAKEIQLHKGKIDAELLNVKAKTAPPKPKNKK